MLGARTSIVAPHAIPAEAASAISTSQIHQPSPHLLIVDGDASVRRVCAEIAGTLGFTAMVADSIPSARSVFARISVDILLLDLKLPSNSSLALLGEIHSKHPETVIIVMTASGTVTSAVETMRTGASDYLAKPFGIDELSIVLERAARRRHFSIESRQLRDRLRSGIGMGSLIGRAPSMEKLYRILSKVSSSSHPVLVLGESGSGKELVARSIHSNGPHAAKPFIPIDCGSLIPNSIESELFGHVKGAFPGANRSKEGILAAAGEGTVFFDEIGELPLDLQAKLLRALHSREVHPTGASQPVPISARILAATKRDLPALVATGRFRKDLYFRLNVVNIRIPPLRERRSDIPLLAAHVLERIQRETGTAYTFSDNALHLMCGYDWPGNVRELESAIERACALSSGPTLHVTDFPSQLQDHRRHVEQKEAAEAALEEAPENTHGVVPIAALEKQAILSTIRQLNGDKLMAARLLGIGKTTLYRKLKDYGIDDD